MKIISIEQQKILDEVKNHWVSLINSSDFDEEKSKECIDFLYEIGGYETPLKFVFDSPLAMKYAYGNIQRYIDLIYEKPKKLAIKNCINIEDMYPNEHQSEVCNRINNKINEKIREPMTNHLNITSEKNVIYKYSMDMRYQIESKTFNHLLSNQRLDIENLKIRSQVINQIEEQIENQTDSQVNFKIKSKRLSQIYAHNGLYENQEQFAWIGYYECFSKLGLINHEKFNQLKELLKSNFFNSIMQKDYCLICKPPIFLKRDERNRMHCMNDYAIYFKDGFGVHYIHGIYFEPELFNKIKENKITGKEILNLKNLEQKAVLIQEFGYEKILDDLDDYQILDEYIGNSSYDGKKVKYQVIQFKFNEMMNARFVKVECHTEHKTTTLGVPIQKNTETCKGAIAWTFGVEEKEYTPIKET